MEKPTLEQMEAWRDQATERLSVLARNNAIEEPIEIGEECYQLGDDCCKPDGYGQFRWVTEDQFDSVLPPGIEHDRYVTMTNTVGFDDEIEEWADNWNDPEYWDDAADEALGEGQADGAYWTTRDEDPADANSARALAASQIALELDGEHLIERAPENIGLLHDIVDTIHDTDPEDDLGYYRAWPSMTARETIGEHLTDGEIAEKAMYGGWNPDRDPYLRVNKDGDWVGMSQDEADRLGLGERSTYQRRGTVRRAGPRQHHAPSRRMVMASRRRGLATDETGRRTHGRIRRPGAEPSIGHRQLAAGHRGPVFRHKHRPMGVHDGRRLHHSGRRRPNHAGTGRRSLVSSPLG